MKLIPELIVNVICELLHTTIFDISFVTTNVLKSLTYKPGC
jgi:hypothetical protein